MKIVEYNENEFEEGKTEKKIQISLRNIVNKIILPQ